MKKEKNNIQSHDEKQHPSRGVKHKQNTDDYESWISETIRMFSMLSNDILRGRIAPQ